MSHPALRKLPPVQGILAEPILATFGREASLRAVRSVLDESRAAILRGEDPPIDPSSLARRARMFIEADRPRLRSVINATGILLNTGLGRAPLASEAVEEVARVARGYCNLEFDLEEGNRGRRTDGVEELLTRLTGAEAAVVVNNNAAATILAVRALAGGREVIVSRGQLVEIGGSFRLPEIIEVSGARLVEVGTTNKTRVGDYARAIGPDTAAILRVHPSNYRVVGFTEEAALPELAELAQKHDLWLIDDIGSGALAMGMPPHVRGEPTAAESMAGGADLVLFSGDKLLGGPQSGILIGTREAVEPLRRDPLMRALRVDKMTIAALEATLRLASGGSGIPLWDLLEVPIGRLKARAEILAEAFRSKMGLSATVEESTAFLGGGSAPTEPIPTAVVRVEPPFPSHGRSEGAWARALRMGDPSVVPRVRGGAVLFDLKAVPEADDARLLEAVRASLLRSDPDLLP